MFAKGEIGVSGWAGSLDAKDYIQNGKAMWSYYTAQEIISNLLEQNMMEDEKKNVYTYVCVCVSARTRARVYMTGSLCCTAEIDIIL